MNAAVQDKAGAGDIGTLSDWVAPGRTALVIIDMQVDFASPDGVLGQAGVDMAIVQPALAQAERLAASARAAGVPVVFVGLMTQKGLDSPSWRERGLRRGGSADDDGGLCRAGERGSEFYGPLPAPGELIIPKIRYSGFYGTTLDTALKGLGVDTIVACGLTTECCVDCTVRDAFHLDYHVFLPTDACAAYETDLHEGTLKSLELNCAILVTTDQVAAAWQESVAHG
jgi:ureidoacrylate peracid hydrolase